MEVPPEVWGRLGLADIRTDPQLASQSGLVPQEQAESMIASLTSQTNCLILNRPVIQTSDGRRLACSLGKLRPRTNRRAEPGLPAPAWPGWPDCQSHPGHEVRPSGFGGELGQAAAKPATPARIRSDARDPGVFEIVMFQND